MVRLRFVALLIGAGLLAGCQSQPVSIQVPERQPQVQQRESERRVEAVPSGSFDYYLLTLSWSPEYCYSHRGAAQCQAHAGFVLHGLWPENRDGTYPERCGGGRLDGDVDGADAYPDPRLAQHEWQAHGTCSGLTPAQYFGAAGKAFRSIAVPQTFQRMDGQIMLSPDDIAREFRQANPALLEGSVSVGCRNGFLTQVEVCLDKQLHAVACGGGLRSCNAPRVKVPAP